MIKYLGFIIRVVPYLIYIYPKLVYLYLTRKKTSRVYRYNWIRKVVINVLKKLHVEIHAQGFEKIKSQQAYIFAPNHQSFLDSLIMIALNEEPTTFVAKIESKKYPFVGKAIQILDGLFLNRINLRQEIKIMQDVRKSLKEDNLKWLIFPEGTRSKDIDFKLGEFKSGTFKAPMSANVNIYPVAMWGSFRALSFKGRYKRYPVQVSVLNPILPSEYENLSTSDVSKLVQSKVENEIVILKEKDKNLLVK